MLFPKTKREKKPMNNNYTYISLFSGAGIGCYGFNENHFQCIATNELHEKRIGIQKINAKCKYDSGYICGDITTDINYNLLLAEVEKWRKLESINHVDVIVATPPCQGMSTANYKKGNEQKRNSLVTGAIKIIKNIKPRIFIFENVKAFMNTICTDLDNKDKPISESIYNNLSKDYNIFSKVINFKDYGVPSSRPRTIVIGTSKQMLNITPLNLFPVKQKEITLKKAIGHLKPLSWGENDENDMLHFAREYPRYMEEWITDLHEGQSAFQNEEDKKPYKIVNGKRQLLRSAHLGNKFRRLFWNKPGACISTRNDQLASQDTIHPSDNRVLSIRELMILMTIPSTFKWSLKDISAIEERKRFFKKNELNIRRCIGEAVPTKIIYDIAKSIKIQLEFEDYLNRYKKSDLKNHIKKKELKLNFYIKSFLEEELLHNRKTTGSFYTPQSVVFHALKNYKPDNLETLRILEPAVGLGAFIPQLIRITDNVQEVIIDAVDISEKALKTLKELLNLIDLPPNIKINYIHKDFLHKDFIIENYDLVVTNPPYGMPGKAELKAYRESFGNKSSNLFDFFMQKLRGCAKEIICIIPKNFLMAAGYENIRKKYEGIPIVAINDFGVKYFKKVFVEIISLHFKKDFKEDVIVESLFENIKFQQKQGYIFHDRAWLLYRNTWFDDYIKQMKLNYFSFFRDRQITNKHLKAKGRIRILKSKNILDSGEIISIPGYDVYIDSMEGFTVKKFLNKDCIIMPNFTYNTRATRLPKNCLPNGSIAILIPKNNKLSNVNLTLYATEAFRKYYAIVKNNSKFTINIDSSSIYYIGVSKNG